MFGASHAAPVLPVIAGGDGAMKGQSGVAVPPRGVGARISDVQFRL